MNPSATTPPVSTTRTYLANLRHELRTPLNAIIGYSEMLLEDADDVAPSVLEPLQQIRQNGSTLLVAEEESPPQAESATCECSPAGQRGAAAGWLNLCTQLVEHMVCQTLPCGKRWEFTTTTCYVLYATTPNASGRRTMRVKPDSCKRRVTPRVMLRPDALSGSPM